MVADIEGYELEIPFYESRRHVLCRGRRLADGRAVIVKALNFSSSEQPQFAGLEHEHEMIASVDSPHVPKALALEHEPGKYSALVLEDIGAVQSLAAHEQLAEASLTLLLNIALQACTAIEAVHRAGVIHYDVKPANFVYDHETQHLQLVDFGLALKLSIEEPQIHSDDLVGTLPYLSPEQTGRMNRPVDHRSDLYSLGVVLYELLTRSRPFEAEDLMGWVHNHIAVTPVAVHERTPSVPKALSAIVERAMAKDPEHRYQSAFGLLVDLRHCAEQLERNGTIEPFELGREDVSRSFDIPAKLYGRTRELARLEACLAHARLAAPPRLTLVAGTPGIGKSSLVRELRRQVVASRGMMVSGKFDQLQRGTPLTAFSELLEDLGAQLLAESQTRLDELRTRVDAALGRNAGVLRALAPGLEFLLGEGEVLELGGLERVNRLKLVVERFVSAIGRPERPLVLFFDDLQWIDAASSMLLTHLLSSPELPGVLIVGAYRSNEVDSAHLLHRTLESMRETGVDIELLELDSLGPSELQQLLADSLHRPGAELDELARLVHDKTEGNPFYVRMFLRELHRGQLLRFDEQAHAWTWEPAEIAAHAGTENVGELLLRRLETLPAETQKLVRVAACIGNRFELATLAKLADSSLPELARALWPALEHGLLVTEAGALARLRAEPGSSDESSLRVQLRFRHDRVQSAASASLDDAARTRLDIGRVLQRELAQDPKRAFEVADHLNAGRALLDSASERLELAALDLECGRRAVEAGAYGAALTYLQTAQSLLEASEGASHELAFGVALELTRALYLDGDYAAASARYEGVHALARSTLEHLSIHGVQLEHSMLAADYDAGFAACRAAFALQGIELPERDEDAGAMVGAELGAMEANLAGRSIAELRQAPELEDPAVRGLLSFLNGFGALTYLSGRWTLNAWGIAKMVNLSLVHGRSNLASFAYGYFGFFLALQGELERAEAFGNLGLALTEDYDDPTIAGRTIGAYLGLAGHYARPLSELVPHFYRTYPQCLEAGDLMYAGYHLLWGDFHKLASGAPLPAVMSEVEHHLRFFSRLAPVILTVFYQPHVIYLCCELMGIDQSELGLSFDSAGFLTAFAELGIAKGWHGSALLKRDYLLGHRPPLAELEQLVLGVETGVAAQHHVAESYLYASLSLLEALREAPGAATLESAERERAREHIERWRAKLASWAKACPANFAVKLALVEAELARNAEQPLGETMAHYEQALEQARQQSSLDLEALASLRYAEFWRAQGSRRSAALYLRGAHELYQRWGAARIVGLLEQQHPSLRRSPVRESDSVSRYSVSRSRSSRQAGGVSTQLALEAMNKAADAIAGETSVAALVTKLAAVMRESLGARRCLILLPEESAPGRWRVLGDEDAAVSDAVVNYVHRSGQLLVLDDAVRDSRWASDAHIAERRSKSLLCAPITLQDELIGLLYADNELSAGVFTPRLLDSARVVVAQAAISLENARLFEALVEQEQQLRQSQKMEAVGTLAGGIAHDFNNLLTVVRGAAELGQLDTPADQAELSTYFGEILEATERAEQLTRQLLTFSRKQLNRPVALDLNELVHNLVKMIARLLGADIELVLELSEQPCHVHADPGQLEQILVNLSVNARDAMPRGGRLLVSTTIVDEDPAEPRVALRVSDSGVGIDAATCARIFDPFFTTKEAGKGTGLGLAMVHGIVTQHGGTIEVDSEPGAGTSFLIQLPRTDGISDEARSEQSERTVGGKELILLAEDDDHVRGLAAKMLTGLGYTVHTASNGERALALAEELEHIDLLLTDVVMPRMGGPELVAALTELRPELPVLYVSGYADDAIARHGLDVTQLRLLHKPFTLATLAGAIRETLEATNQ